MLTKSIKIWFSFALPRMWKRNPSLIIIPIKWHYLNVKPLHFTSMVISYWVLSMCSLRWLVWFYDQIKFQWMNRLVRTQHCLFCVHSLLRCWISVLCTKYALLICGFCLHINVNLRQKKNNSKHRHNFRSKFNLTTNLSKNAKILGCCFFI